MDEKLCKKLEELHIKPKELDHEYAPHFEVNEDDVDCNTIFIMFLIAEKRKRVADQKARQEEAAKRAEEQQKLESAA